MRDAPLKTAPKRVFKGVRPEKRNGKRRDAPVFFLRFRGEFFGKTLVLRAITWYNEKTKAERAGGQKFFVLPEGFGNAANARMPSAGEEERT